MDYIRCVKFMKYKHGNQTRIQGTPYYEHPLAVSKILCDKGFDIDYQVAGLFHDLLEDTDTTYDEIIKLSNNDILQCVLLLTKEPNYNMQDYIMRIRNNNMAKMVKLVDRIHNLREAKYASSEFIVKYIKETEKWYLDLSMNTIFEQDLRDALNDLKDRVVTI